MPILLQATSGLIENKLDVFYLVIPDDIRSKKTVFFLSGPLFLFFFVGNKERNSKAIFFFLSLFFHGSEVDRGESGIFFSFPFACRTSKVFTLQQKGKGGKNKKVSITSFT